MSTVAAVAHCRCQRRQFSARNPHAGGGLHPRGPEPGTAPDCGLRRPVRPRGDFAGCRDAVEAKEPGVMRGLLAKAAGLGFTSVEIPEEYGGMGMDKITSTVVTDYIAMLASFSTAFGAQTGIGTLPLVWYGTEEQKQKYLPRLASGEWVAAYALSEASSGSDAMNIRTRATLSPDGSPLHPHRRKDVDHQLRVRGPVHRLRQDRRRPVLGFPGRADFAGAESRRGGAQAGNSRVVHLPAGAGQLPGARREPARRGREGPSHRL